MRLALKIQQFSISSLGKAGARGERVARPRQRQRREAAQARGPLRERPSASSSLPVLGHARSATADLEVARPRDRGRCRGTPPLRLRPLRRRGRSHVKVLGFYSRELPSREGGLGVPVRAAVDLADTRASLRDAACSGAVPRAETRRVRSSGQHEALRA